MTTAARTVALAAGNLRRNPIEAGEADLIGSFRSTLEALDAATRAWFEVARWKDDAGPLAMLEQQLIGRLPARGGVKVGHVSAVSFHRAARELCGHVGSMGRATLMMSDGIVREGGGGFEIARAIDDAWSRPWEVEAEAAIGDLLVGLQHERLVVKPAVMPAEPALPEEKPIAPEPDCWADRILAYLRDQTEPKMGKHIRKALGVPTQDQVRTAIGDLRRLGWPIETKRGAGYLLKRPA
jgi:biotin operon repressor